MEDSNLEVEVGKVAFIVSLYRVIKIQLESWIEFLVADGEWCSVSVETEPVEDKLPDVIASLVSLGHRCLDKSI